MKNLLTFFLLISVISAYSQRNSPGREEIESYKIAFLTERLELTPDVAKKFWPIYNEFGQKKDDLRIERSKLRLDLSKSELSNEDAERILKSEFELKQKELDLEREYYKKFSNVLDPKGVVNLLKSEMDFNREMLRRLRRQGQGRGGPQ